MENIIKRMQEIQDELAKPEANVEDLRKEFDALKDQKRALEVEKENRSKLMDEIKNENLGVVVRKFTEAEKAEVDPIKELNSETYTRAFLKDMLAQDLTAEEQRSFDIVTRAFIHTTANTGAVVPAELQNKIYSTMEEAHPLMADVTILRTGTVMSIVKHTAIVAGDASNVSEGVANADEQNTFVNVTLSGQDISKHVDYSYRLGKMAIPAFEAYLVKEIGDRIGSQWADNIVAQIKSDLNASNKNNAITAGTLAIDDLLLALSELKGVGRVNIYTNNATLWGKVYSMVGADGRQAYIPNYQDNISGQLLGMPVKQEDALGAGEVLILDPTQYVENVVQDLLIERDKNIKSHVHTIAGLVIAGGTLTNDKAGVLITIGVAG